MLNRKEKFIMAYIFEKCQNKDSVLISPEELQNYSLSKFNISLPEIGEIIENLVLENYITMVLSDKKGSPIYCISLDKKGEGFLREQKNKRKSTVNIIVRTVLLAILSFVVGVLLKAIFS